MEILKEKYRSAMLEFEKELLEEDF